MKFAEHDLASRKCARSEACVTIIAVDLRTCLEKEIAYSVYRSERLKKMRTCMRCKSLGSRTIASEAEDTSTQRDVLFRLLSWERQDAHRLGWRFYGRSMRLPCCYVCWGILEVRFLLCNKRDLSSELCYCGNRLQRPASDERKTRGQNVVGR